MLDESTELFFQAREAAGLNFIQHIVGATYVCDVAPDRNFLHRIDPGIERLQSLVQRSFVECTDTHGSTLIQLRRAKSSVQIKGSGRE